MPKKDHKTERKAAPLVKCPYCDHQGSSRGLFSHVRLAHQGKTIPKTNEWKQHPYSVAKKPTLTEKIAIVKNRPKFKSTEDFFLQLLIEVANNLIAQSNRKGRIGYITDRNNP